MIPDNACPLRITALLALVSRGFLGGTVNRVAINRSASSS